MTSKRASRLGPLSRVRRWLGATVALCGYLTCPSAATAQTTTTQSQARSSSSATTLPIAAEVDLRIGNWWPLVADQSLPTVGGRLAIYPWKRSAARRLSVQVVGDYRQLSRTEDYDFDLGSGFAFTQHLFHVMPAMGVDVVQTGHVALDVRAGLAIIGRRSTFALETDFDPDDGDNFENVCRFTAFRDYCDSDYETSGALGVGLRVRPFRVRPLYVGVDYMRLFGPDEHVLVGSVGWRVE